MTAADGTEPGVVLVQLLPGGEGLQTVVEVQPALEPLLRQQGAVHHHPSQLSQHALFSEGTTGVVNSHSCFVSQCCGSGSIIWTLVNPDPEAKGVRLKIKIHHSDTQLTVYIFGSTTLFFLDLKYVQYYQFDTYRS